MIEHHLRQVLGPTMLSPAGKARGRRVMLLLSLVAILSVGDLLVTMIFLGSTGMVELNPLAAYMIRNQSAAGLVCFKLGSVLMSVSILLMIRHTRRGEIAAWIAACILVALMFHWSRYTEGAEAFANTRFLEMTQEMEEWVTMPVPGVTQGTIPSLLQRPVQPLPKSGVDHAPAGIPGADG